MTELFSMTSRPDTPPNAAAEQWSGRRTAPRQEDQSLTSDAHRWLHKVPSGLHPKRLARQYPRIANRLAAAWSDVTKTEALFEDLLTDRRGGRRGFAQAIVSELERLRHLHRNRQRVGLFIVRRR